MCSTNNCVIDQANMLAHNIYVHAHLDEGILVVMRISLLRAPRYYPHVFLMCTCVK